MTELHHSDDLDTATFAAGCFWGVEETFRQVPGVRDATVGYTGGSIEHPTYTLVCTGRTGHAEAVQVRYDPREVNFEELVRVFFAAHDPTTRNRQGWDVGSQYRSAIFYHSPEQQEIALRLKDEQSPRGMLKRRPVTQIEPATTFWAAEEYHQQYLARRGMGACTIPSAEPENVGRVL